MSLQDAPRIGLIMTDVSVNDASKVSIHKTDHAGLSGRGLPFPELIFSGWPLQSPTVNPTSMPNLKCFPLRRRQAQKLRA